MNILLTPFYPALPARAAVLFKIRPTLVLRPRRFSEKVGVNKKMRKSKMIYQQELKDYLNTTQPTKGR
jgi:hypothetical protein